MYHKSASFPQPLIEILIRNLPDMKLLVKADQPCFKDVWATELLRYQAQCRFLSVLS